MDPTQPFDLETQSLAAQQKQAIAQALQKRSQEPPSNGQMVSGHYVSNGPLSALSQVLTAYMAKSAQGDANAAQSAYGDNYRKQLGEGLKSYLDTRSGTPGQVLNDQQADNLMNNDKAPPPLSDGTPADPRKAITAAMTSRIPELQKIGAMDFPNLIKGEQGELKELNGTLWRVYPDGTKQPAMLADARNPVHANNQVFKADGTRIVDARDQFNPVGELAHPPGGPAIYGATEKTTGKVEFAPGGSTFNADNKGTASALEQTGAVLKETKAQYAAGNQAFTDAQRMQALAKDPSVTTGFAANKILGLKALAAKFGFGDADGVARTQALVADLSKRTLDAGQQMKGSFSDPDIVFLKGLSNGSIELTPEVLQHAAGLSMAAGHNMMIDAQRQHSDAEGVTGAGEIAKLHRISQVADHTMSPDMFEETAPDHFRYKSPLLGYGAQTPQTAPTVSNWPGSK